MVRHELNSQLVLLKEQVDQKTDKNKQHVQQAEQQATELQMAKATVTTLTFQLAQLEQQLRDLSLKATAAATATERAVEIKAQELLESQAAVRQLIKEAADSQKQPA